MSEMSKTDKKHALDSLRMATMCIRLRNNETRIDVALDFGRRFEVTLENLEEVLSMSVKDALEFKIVDQNQAILTFADPKE